MKLRKEHIIAIGAFTLLLLTVGGVYEFYYSERLQEYDKNRKRMEDLEKTLTRLESKEVFDGCKPDALISAVRGSIQPLREEVVRRAAFFNTGDALDIAPIPEGKMLKFYYADEFNKMINQLRQDAYARVPFCPFPEASTFGAPRPEEFENRPVTAADVKQGLKRLKFGSVMIKMLMDAKALAILDVVQWPPRVDYDGLLTLRTFGISMVMRYADFVAFLDSLRMKERYYSVDGISVQNRYLRWPIEPAVEVQLFLTQADFNLSGVGGGSEPGGGGPAPAAGPAPMAPAAPAVQPDAAQRLEEGGFARRETPPPPSKWSSIKRWLRNHYLWPF